MMLNISIKLPDVNVSFRSYALDEKNERAVNSII